MCGQPWKNLKGLPQVLLGPFLNILSQTAHATKWYEQTSLTREPISFNIVKLVLKHWLQIFVDVRVSFGKP